MHFFIAWKTEKNKIHFSEHVHEPAIIFFVYVQMLYLVSYSCILCIQCTSACPPITVSVTSMFKFVSYPAWRFLVWHFSILRWFSDPSTLHQTGGAKLYIGRVRPEIHPLTLLYAFLDRKGTPLVYLLLTNGTSHKLV